MTNRLVFVKWSDAHGSGGSWEPVENAVASRLIVYSVGWLIDQTSTEVCLLQSMSSSDEEEMSDAFYNKIVIPKGMILDMQTIGDLSDK